MSTTLDELDEIDQLVSDQKPAEKKQPKLKGIRGVLYFDIETVPDYSRSELFDLEPIPEPTKRTPLADCPPAESFLTGTLESFKVAAAKVNPPNEVLDAIDDCERKAPKPRKGVFDVTAELRGQDAAREAAIVARRKLMSITPEMNRIVAIGLGDSEQIESMVDGVDNVTEKSILEEFWRLARTAKQICGFNVLHFDLPTIYVRSILLDVAPTKQFDLRPWSLDVIDLMVKRFPKSGAVGLKKLAKLMGITIPTEDVDGSKVEELWNSNPAKVGEYVRSDIAITRELHLKYRDFFC